MSLLLLIMILSMDDIIAMQYASLTLDKNQPETPVLNSADSLREQVRQTRMKMNAIYLSHPTMELDDGTSRRLYDVKHLSVVLPLALNIGTKKKGLLIFNSAIARS